MDKEKLKPYEVIVEHFKEFFQKNGNDSYKMINSFYEKERKIFSKNKINELIAQGETYEEAVIKTRQSWVSIIGKSLEKIFEILIIDFCHKNNLKITVELIIILYKNEWKKKHKGVSDISKEDFIAWTNGLWTFSGESKKRIGHPAPFPKELPKRCIKLFSFIGDTIFDPFSGSGTTILEAIENERIGIGLELDVEYCKLSKKRILENIGLFF